MPMFGSSSNDNKLNKHNQTTDLDGTGYGTGTGAGLGRTHETYPATGMGVNEGMMGEPGMGNTMGGRQHAGTHHHQGMGMHNEGMGMGNDGMMADQQYGAGGMGAGTGTTGIPPSTNINSQHRSGGGGGAMTGKIEHVVGSLVGSKSLKAKGIQKEQEARGLKIQSQELAEAERLEHEAGIRRERAVAHGAHPDNRHVGGLGGGVGTGSNAYD
ncbi:hypothetical protein B0H14DRAFT_1692402 [Mycena olivaceomarginata]|nr:hypothetical protein B0H14DRAFT_1692402 [Mycena olivaceomarginata]